ncbi:Shikimate dehydrogenase [Variovorax sp. PBS-H4]|uniref:shikimate dehydrogenase family protein n=1 Tax=Variovorax sp. PBS-H4 TaxID=434008 RepID=UPI001318063D|nr:shikimate dehydrogenase [Variovorax sp. PBS-H4]VTU36453.1 Shikimate dehydrogenase [Variovorax sp. PBS-H4]
MLDSYTGATRVIFIAGDPIAQVKSPAAVTRLLRERGADTVVVPAHVKPADFGSFLGAVERMPNVDGVIATVPHKFALAARCAELTPRARSIVAANVARRRPGGGWFGDMCDGDAYVAGLARHRFDPRGRRALLVGAGGAGSAIAHSLVDAGVSALALHDLDAGRRDALLEKIARYGSVAPSLGSDDPRGFDLVINASPAGMKDGDPSPIDGSRIEAGMFIGDVITSPEITPLLAAARARGCATMTGLDMFRAVGERIAAFYLEKTSS